MFAKAITKVRLGGQAFEDKFILSLATMFGGMDNPDLDAVASGKQDKRPPMATKTMMVTTTLQWCCCEVCR